MTGLTQRDDIKKQVSEILKRVDQFIRTGSIEIAMKEILHARDLDPSNPYIHAYEERLEYLRQEHEKHLAEEKTLKEAEEMARERDRKIRARMAEEQRRLPKEQKKISDGRTRLNKQTQVESKKPITQQPAQVTALPAEISGQPRMARNELDRSEIKISRNTVLVIDDDVELLGAITQTLNMSNLEVVSLTTSDEAFTLLKKWVPGLILCDINLETSTMGGFSFYEAIRQLEHLNKVPFIFLTGLNDHILIRTGKEMGVDDYLTKPISGEALVATIKGKLKRFALMNRKG
jgi:PleD family two-component response regulator